MHDDHPQSQPHATSPPSSSGDRNQPEHPKPQPGKDSATSRYENFQYRIKNHKWIAVLLIIGVATISLAAFTDALTKLGFFLDGLVALKQARPSLKVLIDDTEPLRVDFSVVNVSPDTNIELTAITATQLVQVDLCRLCSFEPRQALHLQLREGVSDGQQIEGEFPLGRATAPVRVFGALGVQLLAPGESAPFSLRVSTPGHIGSVFHLTLSTHDLKHAEREDLVPPYLFYFVGPPDYSTASVRAVAFHAWLEMDDSYLRANIARALGLLGDKRGEESLLDAAASDRDSSVRAAALRALSNFNSGISFNHLLNALSGRNIGTGFDTQEAAAIRRAAAAALGERKDPRATSHLLTAWRSDRGFWVANEAIESFGKLTGPAGFTTLREVLYKYDSGNAAEWQSRSSIVKAIGYTGDERASELLIEQLSFESGHWDDRFSRQEAAKALQSCSTIQCRDALLTTARSGLDPWSQSEAINSLVALKAYEAKATLEEIANFDSDDFVRRAAQLAITELEK